MAGHTQLLTGSLSARLGALLTLVIFSRLMNPAKGINISISLVPAEVYVGEPVLLNVTDVSGQIRSFTWYKDELFSKNQILHYIPSAADPQTKGGKFFSEAIAFPNASLYITSVTDHHYGDYTVQVQTGTPLLQANITLTKPKPRVGLIVGISVGVLVVVCAGVAFLLWFLKYKKKNSNNAERPKDSYANVDKSDNE